MVEQTLLGNAADLKERSIGIEVFGRSPSYDANADPVVRITAGEVRKRLSQYYYDSAHEENWSSSSPSALTCPSSTRRTSRPNRLPSPLWPTGSYFLRRSHPVRGTRNRSAGASAGSQRAFLIVLAGALGLGVGLRYHPTQPIPPPSNIDRFWEPFTSSADPATFCLGEPAKNLDTDSINDFEAPVSKPEPEKLYVRLHYSGNLALADVITLTRVAAQLEIRHKTFRVEPASEATFSQLREGPIVLIGAFDNIWTLRVTQKLRFGFESKDGVATLVDRKSQKNGSWATAWDLPYEKLSRDYAIVARIHDSTTGQPVIIAAGISEEGTEAAGEILYNPVYLDRLLAKAPADWEKKNMEAVIETQVIQGHSGPPNILAVETW